MPVPTPFHPRTSELCTSMRWKEWAGYYTVCSYDTCHEREYYAFRHAAGMIDVTPLFKYEVRGPDAGRWLSRLTVKNVAKMKVGHVTYLCWCDDHGRLIDDGTVMRLAKDHYRITSAEPSWSWFQRFTRGYDITLEDVSNKIASVSLQGPNSREILRQCCDANMDKFRFFRLKRCKLDGLDALITRTGYTGDLGFEIWVDNEDALKLWDALIDVGKPYGIEPCGMDAMDVTRVEAGFIMNGVDYHSAHHCLIEDRMSTPYEAGLGWTVQLDREPFIGQAALKEEKAAGPAWNFVGVEIDWPQYEAVCAQYGLPPQVGSAAWRHSVPVYDDAKNQIGYATSGSWSPLLKKSVALCHIKKPYYRPGTEVQFEVTVEHTRHTVKATVVKTPFFDPPRKRS
ncbi:MAG: aminomethyltransferase family protein [Acidobacteriota bacterium]|nr:aminomethyltransferase family protein [Acidobacteriota bacterium]